MRSKACFN